MDFLYKEVCDLTDNEKNFYLMNTKLKDAQSKHFVLTEQNKILEILSKKADYKYSIFGSNHNSNICEEKNRIVNMSTSSCERPLRFVIDNYGRIWADNTHWCIAYILKYGKNTTLIDIPVYIVDFRENLPIIVNINNTIYDSIDHVKNAIRCAYDIQNRINLGWRPKDVSYCIEDLIKELEF